MEMNRLRSLMLLLIAVFALNAFAVSAYAAEGEKPLVEALPRRLLTMEI